MIRMIRFDRVDNFFALIFPICSQRLPMTGTKKKPTEKTLINCLNFFASMRWLPNKTKSKSMFHIFRFATLPLNGIKVNGKPSLVFKYLWWCDCYNGLIYPSSIHKMQTISHFVSVFPVLQSINNVTVALSQLNVYNHGTVTAKIPSKVLRELVKYLEPQFFYAPRFLISAIL